MNNSEQSSFRSQMGHRLTIASLVCLTAFFVAGCSPMPSVTSIDSDSLAGYSSSEIAISETPVYRLIASQVRGSERRSAYKYEHGNLIANFEYDSVSEYAYSSGGLTRQEKTDGNNGIATTYTENAICDERGRITSVERTESSGAYWKFNYTYYGDTLKLKTLISQSNSTRVTEYNEDGFVTSIEETSGYNNESERATFVYELIDDDNIRFIYTNFKGETSAYYIFLDENGNVGSITDGTTYVDFLYEEIIDPSAWLFTETDSSTAMCGYTTRALFDTW